MKRLIYSWPPRLAGWVDGKTNPRFVDPFQEKQHVAKGYFDIYSHDRSCWKGIKMLHNITFCVVIMQCDRLSQSWSSGSLNVKEAGMCQECYQFVFFTY